MRSKPEWEARTRKLIQTVNSEREEVELQLGELAEKKIEKETIIKGLEYLLKQTNIGE